MRKLFYGLLLTLLLSAALVFAFDMRLVRTSPTTIYVPHDYPTIQEAVNHASDGDTIIVRQGSYDEGEKLTIDRSVALFGQDSPTIKTKQGIETSSSNTSINGFNIFADETPYCCIYVASNCTIEGNIIKGSTGIDVVGAHCTISDNYVSPITDDQAAGEGIAIFGNDCLVINNTVANFLKSYFTNYPATGIYLGSSTNTIAGNTILKNNIGIEVDQIAPPASSPAEGNRIYHNNLKNNTIPVAFFRPEWANHTSLHNFWDDGYPSGGNYYSGYSGTDVYRGPHQDELGSDGIGDVPYIFDQNNTDYYPLMNPYPAPTYEFSMNCTPTCPKPFVSSTAPRENEPVQIRASINTSADRMALFYRVNGNDWWSTPMQPSSGSWILTLPGQPADSTVEFYVTAYSGYMLLATSKTYSYAVKDLFTGDINGDGIVNILDITIVAREFGKK